MLNLSLLELSESITSGLTPLRSNDEFWNNGIIPWLKTEQLGEKYIFDTNEFISLKALDETSIKLNKENTLSIAMYGEGRTRGSVSILKNKMTTNQACCNVYLDDTKADYEYVYYFLKTQYDNLRSLSSGVRKNLNSNDIKNFKINIPKDIEEQKKIANVLSSLDSKIELNNKINKELESIAKTLYDYWFVQFDFPNENGKPYKSSGGKMVYSKDLKREIPESWKQGTLGDISDLVRGVSYDKNDIKNVDDKDVIPILRATNITGNIIDLDDMVYVPKVNVSQKQLLKKFEILMTMSSGSKEHIGKNAFFYYDKEISFGAFCAKLVPKKDFEFYLYAYTQSNFMFDTIKNECLGTNINNLNNSLVNGFQIVIPNKNQIEKFNKIVSSIYKEIANIQEQNQKLAKLRDWLLPMLMNGQVKVK